MKGRCVGLVTIERCRNCPYKDCIRSINQENRDNYNRYRAENLEKERERDRLRAKDESRKEKNRRYYQ